MSQNALFVKLLDLKAKQEEFNNYVDRLLGVHVPEKGAVPAEWKDWKEPVMEFFKYFSMPLEFMKRGPYERDFDERITKLYLAPLATTRYLAIVNYLKKKIGIGG